VVVGIVIVCVPDDCCMAHNEFPKGLINIFRSNILLTVQ